MTTKPKTQPAEQDADLWDGDDDDEDEPEYDDEQPLFDPDESGR